MTAPNLLPYFNGEGHYLHALIALGLDRVRDKSFYAGMNETIHSHTSQVSTVDSTVMQDDTCSMMDIDTNNTIEGQNTDVTDRDEGAENLDMMLNVMGDQKKLKQDVLMLGNAFIKDVQERIGQMDTQYLTDYRNF